jgi:hypothetical protein
MISSLTGMTIRLGLSIRRRRLEEEWSKPDRSNPAWSAAYSQRLSSYPFLRSIQELRLLNTSLRASRPTIAIEMVPRQNSCSRSAAKSRVRQAQARLMNGFPSSVHLDGSAAVARCAEYLNLLHSGGLPHALACIVRLRGQCVFNEGKRSTGIEIA